MNKNAKKWIKALRSGEFKRTESVLNNECGYCCLGVACAVYERETGKMLPRDKNGYYYHGCLKREFSVVKEWVGLKDDVGSLENDPKRSLAYYNDNYGSYDGFNDVADLIEKNQEELFTKGENNE